MSLYHKPQAMASINCFLCLGYEDASLRATRTRQMHDFFSGDGAQGAQGRDRTDLPRRKCTLVVDPHFRIPETAKKAQHSPHHSKSILTRKFACCHYDGSMSRYRPFLHMTIAAAAFVEGIQNILRLCLKRMSLGLPPLV